MLRADEFRQLLVADMALVMEVVEAHDVAAALMRYWDQREAGGTTLADELIRIAKLDADALAPVEAEVERLIGEADGDPQLALTRRGGLDRSIHLALSGTAGPVSIALTKVGAGARSPLPTVRPHRYIDFMPAGQGGMGLVYMALDTELNRLVAFKMVRPEGPTGDTPATPVDVSTPEHNTPASKAFDELKARFLQEAWVTGGLEHPGIVPVYELGQTKAGIPFYTMRFVRGQRTFKEALNEVRHGPVEDRLALLEPFLKLCDTVRYAHSRGVVHRDLKPANVALGEFGEVVLLDWGLAKLEGREDVAASRWQERVQDFRSAGELETVGGALGTPGYMAPEAAAGRLEDVDAKSDLYSLGVMLFEILTGRLPFEFTTYWEFMYAVTQRQAPRAGEGTADVPQALDDLCASCLSRDRSKRPEDVAALASAVRSWQAASALEREAAGHLRDAHGALDAAEDATGDERLRQVERAAAALHQARTKEAEPTALADLEARTAALREQAIREREKASTRRVLMRVGAAALVLLAAAGFVVAAVIDTERAEKVRALELANAERDAKARALEEVERLADSKEVRDLLDEAGRLWPRHPDRAPAMTMWVERARRVLGNRPVHEAALAAVRARALPGAGSDQVRFEDARDAWKHQVLTDLLIGLTRLQPREATTEGVFAEVNARLEFASTLHERSLENHAGLWHETITAIADVERYPAYAGLTLAPQLGLVPLGPDPDSHLFEFAHLGSGSMPTRDPETRRLVLPADAALVLVLIPGGTFRMGAQKLDSDGANYDPQAQEDEQPVREVTLSPFFLAKHECTQSQWLALTGRPNPSRYPVGVEVTGETITSRHPVEQVSWDDCVLWLNRSGLSLPSEAQWEYACRAGTATPWFVGRDSATLGTAGNIADRWCKEHGGPADWTFSEEVQDGRVCHAPVGSYAPNAFGLHDMHGNVREWCRDRWLAYEAGPATDPVVDSPGGRVDRGGAWDSAAGPARSAYRFADGPDLRSYALGVRPARRVTTR